MRALPILTLLVAIALGSIALPARDAAAVQYCGTIELPEGAVSFADTVIASSVGAGGGTGVAGNVLGEPNTPCATLDGTTAFSLGAQGSVTVRFDDNRLTGDGTAAYDLWVFEAGMIIEPTDVYISRDNVTYTYVDRADGGASTTSGVDIDDDGFTPQDRIHYARLVDVNGAGSSSTRGADINAIGAIETVLPPAPIGYNDTYVANKSRPLVVPVGTSVLANDTTATGLDLITNSTTENATLVSGPTHGTLTVNGDGSFAYTPTAGYLGPDTFIYRPYDNSVKGNKGFVTVNVVQPPVAVDDSGYQITYNRVSPTVLNVMNNDSDPSGLAMAISSVSDPAHGAATILPGGSGTDDSILYTPDANYSGADSFTYAITNTRGGTDTATVTLTVNRPPDAADDSATTAEDTAAVIAVLTNDSDPEGVSFFVVSASDPPHGSVTLIGDGTISYTPDANYNGSDAFTYAIRDLNGGTDTATVSITVTAVNDSPLAGDDSATTAEDTPTTITVLTNDSSPDGGALTITGVTAPGHGTATIDGSGSITYAPSSNFNGTDSFRYTGRDDQGDTATATVTVTVTPVNDPPVARDNTGTVAEDSTVTIAVRRNDNDRETPFGQLDVTAATAPAHGSVVINPDESVTYTPDADYNGPDAFSYTICDPEGACDDADVTITVTPVADAPRAADDDAATGEDAAVIVTVLANDVDPDGDHLRVTDVSTPAHGRVAVNSDGTVTYTPDSNYAGPDSFTYTVSDGNGGGDTATVRITVRPVNDDPVAADDDVTTAEDTAVDIDVLSNDGDVDRDPLTVTDATTPGHGSATITRDGSIIYRPNADFNGTDRFSYTIIDGMGGSDTASVTVTIGAIDDDPTAVDDDVTTDEERAVTTNVLGNDLNPDADGLMVVSVGPAAHGAVAIENDGSVTYTPEAGFNGPDAFTYTISDGTGNRSTATVSITVDPVDDGPVAVDDDASTDEDTAVDIDVLTNDTHQDGDALQIDAITRAPVHGTAEIVGGKVRYTPVPGFGGSDQFNYRVTDTNGDLDEATVTVTIGAVNDSPVATDDLAVTDQGVAVQIFVLFNDRDADGDDLTVSIATEPSSGSGTVNSDGSITYVPDPGFSGTDSFAYTVDDGNGGTGTATVTVNVGDRDYDDDGVLDDADNCPVTANGDQADTDGDGVGDACDAAAPDTDLDDDLVEDAADNCPTIANVDQLDADADGIGDACDAPVLDTDADDDGVADGTDNCPTVANPSQGDGDGDDIGNACDSDETSDGDQDDDGVFDNDDNCPTVANPGQENSDGDALGDACDAAAPDTDADDDGVDDATDNCPTVANPDQANLDGDLFGDACDAPAPVLDADVDGVQDGVDNCPTVANPNQANQDGDLFGDACDIPTALEADNDGDGVDDVDDNCPAAANGDQLDSDGDGIGDACDDTPLPLDTDADGVPDDEDNCPAADNPDQADADGDGVGDACDAAVDNDGDDDGVDDSDDNCRTDANADQADADGDGIGDTCDPSPNGDPTPTPQPTAVPAAGGGGGTGGDVRSGAGLPDTGTGAVATSRQGQWLLGLGLALVAGLTAFVLALTQRRQDELDSEGR